MIEHFTFFKLPILILKDFELSNFSLHSEHEIVIEKWHQPYVNEVGSPTFEIQQSGGANFFDISTAEKNCQIFHWNHLFKKKSQKAVFCIQGSKM